MYDSSIVRTWTRVLRYFFFSAYSIDNGKGGKIHVNVSFFFVIPNFRVLSLDIRAICELGPHITQAGEFNNMVILGLRERISGIQDLSTHIAHGRLNMRPLKKMATSIFFLGWISQGDLFSISSRPDLILHLSYVQRSNVFHRFCTIMG